MKKKAAPVVIEDLPAIKLAGSKKNQNDRNKDKLIIESPILDDDCTLVTEDHKGKKPYTVVVDQCIEISRNIENLQTELVELEDVLKKEAAKAKEKAFNDDMFYKTVYIKGADKDDEENYKPPQMQIQFRESYSAMDIAMEEPLKKIFKEKFQIMFTVVETATLRPEKVEALKTLLADRYNDFFNVVKTVKPSEDFSYNYFQMRKSIEEGQKETVEKVTTACRYQPAVKYPK